MRIKFCVAERARSFDGRLPRNCSVSVAEELSSRGREMYTRETCLRKIPLFLCTKIREVYYKEDGKVRGGGQAEQFIRVSSITRRILTKCNRLKDDFCFTFCRKTDFPLSRRFLFRRIACSDGV